MKNLLKSIYISAYLTAASLVAVYAGWSLWATGEWVAWGSVLLTVVPMVSYLSWITLRQNAPRISARFPFIGMLAVAGAAMSLWAWRTGAAATVPALAVAGVVGFFLVSFWYGSFDRQPSPRLKAGQALPDFPLKTTSGQTTRSGAYAGRPTVWVFFRGNWCPLCMAQVKELAADYQRLEQLGVRVALISPQPHENTVGLAKRFDVPFDFLTDEGNQASRALGIAIEHGIPAGMQVLGYDSETVMPTVIITDTDNNIVWVDETDNYRVRPEPETYLKVLRQNNVLA